ncbi:hypothetical protein HWB99_gp088 [Mycobacterium phage DrLupo]|uniref:Uncharacterized protein n=1 Tax=Mycobacterium phage DrLupo TaxID=2499037 RepID=A0A3S9UQR6_9CAUD|nr:hypothetical protein HWB99_gp088 [Mycobacterium phage DrLupo]AZS12624.1 hypothetical protein SEA_DRLUPO_88 [Mycobacterium phage DrLupo]
MEQPSETDHVPNGACLPCPHVHCDYCENVIPTVPCPTEALTEMLIHLRDSHREQWLSPECAEYREFAPMYGVESL